MQTTILDKMDEKLRPPLPGHNETAREEHVIVGFVPKAGDPDVIRDIGRLTILHYENASNIVLNTSRK